MNEQKDITQDNPIKKNITKEKKEHGLYYTKKEPRKSLGTFFRNQNKFLVSSIAIADRKAMILIRINTTILSALIVFYGYIDTNVEMGGLISVVLIFGTIGSLTCAILAAKPLGVTIHKKFKKVIEPLYPNLSQNNFLLFKQGVSFEEYEQSMNEVVNSQELQIGSQVRASYLFNTSVTKKYMLLTFAYNIFLISFLLVVAIFLVSKFIL